MTTIDVIAQRGSSALIRVDADQGRILDRRHGRLFPAQTIDSALARGYWKPFEGDTAEVAGRASRGAGHVGSRSVAGLVPAGVDSDRRRQSGTPSVGAALDNPLGGADFGQPRR